MDDTVFYLFIFLNYFQRLRHVLFVDQGDGLLYLRINFFFFLFFGLNQFQSLRFSRLFILFHFLNNFLFLGDNHAFDEFQICVQIRIAERKFPEDFLKFFMCSQIVEKSFYAFMEFLLLLAGHGDCGHPLDNIFKSYQAGGYLALPDLQFASMETMEKLGYSGYFFCHASFLFYGR